jgi:hypothetical protein
MYSWTLLSADVNTTPYLLGVTDDLAKAKRLTEPHLISGQALLCLIETVRAAFTVHGMDSCYVRPGPDWLGRLTATGQVGWNEEAMAALGVSWGRRAGG